MTLRLPFHRARWIALGLVLLLSPAEAKPAKIKDLADTVASNPILTKFAAIIQASDLGTFLSSRGPFTLFAPTNSAFAKLPPGTLDTLMRPENKVRLQDILLFHVVNGKKLGAKELQPLKVLLTCEGNPLSVKNSKTGAQFVMKAKIVHADIRCKNGVINEIDTVLMPPESALPPIAAPLPPGPVADTNAAPVSPAAEGNASVLVPTGPADTNAAPVIPIAPVATPASMPEVSPH